MHTLFISDLHLKSDDRVGIKCFFEFLDRECETADALYILGDFFDVWVGDEDCQKYADIIEKLCYFSTLKPIYFMHGNRDFLVGKSFLEKTRIILLSDPTIINLYGKSILLTHGDLLCTGDKNYQIFRSITHQKWIQKVFLTLPLSWREWVGAKLRQNSRGNTQIVDVSDNTVQEWLINYKIEYIIHGHTHRPEIRENRWVLPDWHAGKGGVLKVSTACVPELIFFK